MIRERAQRTIPADILFEVNRIGLPEIDQAGPATARKPHVYGELLCVNAGDTESEHQCHSCGVFHEYLLSVFGGDHSDNVSSVRWYRRKPSANSATVWYIFLPGEKRAVYGRVLC